MNNYVYIISSLPVLSRDLKDSEGLDIDAIIEEIRSQCSEADNRQIDFLTDGFKPEKLTEDFYIKATGSSNGFIREYFTMDLNLRNAKAGYLNRSFGRPEDQDKIILGEEEEIPEYAPQLAAVLESQDLIARERGLDDFVWDAVDDMVTFKYFDLDVILAFIAKLHIIDRWLKLDKATGREMFKKLVGDVRSTFKGVQFEA